MSNLYFYLSTILSPVLLLVIEYYFSNVTVLVLKYKFSLLFPPLVLTPQYSDGDTVLYKAPSFGWDVKPRSWLSVVIKNPRMSFWPNFPIGLWPSWPPNHPHTLIGFITLSPLHQKAGVWWAFWCNMAAVASSRWMLHSGGGWRDSPLLCKAL